MDIEFTSIAFTLKYSSVNIDQVYVALDIMSRGDQKIPTAILMSYKEWLPENFINWIVARPHISNIVFENRDHPDNSRPEDWDLIAF